MLPKFCSADRAMSSPSDSVLKTGKVEIMATSREGNHHFCFFESFKKANAALIEFLSIHIFEFFLKLVFEHSNFYIIELLIDEFLPISLVKPLDFFGIIKSIF